MSCEDALSAEGVVTAVLSERAFRVVLSNGHEMVGHASLRLREAVAGLQAGDMVLMAISPFDLSAGRITKVTKKQS